MEHSTHLLILVLTVSVVHLGVVQVVVAVAQDVVVVVHKNTFANNLYGIITSSRDSCEARTCRAEIASDFLASQKKFTQESLAIPIY